MLLRGYAGSEAARGILRPGVTAGGLQGAVCFFKEQTKPPDTFEAVRNSERHCRTPFVTQALSVTILFETVLAAVNMGAIGTKQQPQRMQTLTSVSLEDHLRVAFRWTLGCLPVT